MNLFRLLSISLISIFCTLSQAQAHTARDLFFHLKKFGDWHSFIEHHTYAHVIGTRFIGLEQASNEDVVCLFGFFEPAEDEEAQTRFVCFEAGRYDLLVLAEYNPNAKLLTNTNPAGISIGIGNLEIVSPTLAGLSPQKAGTYLQTYPAQIRLARRVEAVKQPLPTIPGRPTSSEPWWTPETEESVD